MPSLRELLSTCEEDTRRLFGRREANRLAAWRRYNTDHELVAFIQRTIRNQDNKVNGFLLHSQHGVSLEAIVAIYLPKQFDKEDILIAQQTIDIGK
jgi:hypothetical protein